MKSPTIAILWELWRTNRYETVCRVLAPIGLIALSNQQFQKTTPGEQTVVVGVFVMMLSFACLSSSIWAKQLDRQNMDCWLRLGFTRPVETWKLVAIPMVFLSVCSALSYVVCAWYFRIALQHAMPIAGPACLIATAAACLMAATWSPTTLVAKGIALGAVVTAIWLVYVPGSYDAEPLLMAMGRVEFYSLSWQMITGCIGVFAAAFYVTSYSVNRKRQGEPWRIESLLLHAFSRLRKPAVTGRTAGKVAFANRWNAQCWYEARRIAPPIFITSIVGSVLLFALTSFPGLNGVAYVWLLMIFLSPVIFQFLGTSSALGLRSLPDGSFKPSLVQYSKFDATRSLRNGQSIAIKLLMVVMCSFVAWLILVAFALVHITLFGGNEGWHQIRAVATVVGAVPGYWWGIAVVNGVLGYVWTSAVLLAIGLWMPLYPRTFFGLMCAAYAHGAVAMWDAHHGEFLMPYWAGYGYVVAVLIVLASIFVARNAVNSGCFSRLQFNRVVCLWAVFVVMTVVMWGLASPTVKLPRAVVVLGGAALFVPLAAMTLAPLGLARHRHA